MAKVNTLTGQRKVTGDQAILDVEAFDNLLEQSSRHRELIERPTPRHGMNRQSVHVARSQEHIQYRMPTEGLRRRDSAH
jgi:hypothetical protein